MTEAESLLEKASRALAEGRPTEARGLAERAVAMAADGAIRFDALLHRARAEHAHGEVARALDTYWEARNLTKQHRLGRSGEADLGIGMTLLELGREGEGLEAVRRAARQFRKIGQPFLRGCAETVLAGEALRAADLASAERHLEVADDLLSTSPDPRLLAGSLTLRAEVVARQGRGEAARVLLQRAARLALQVGSPPIVAELRAHRRVVLDLITGPEDE